MKVNLNEQRKWKTKKLATLISDLHVHFNLTVFVKPISGVKQMLQDAAMNKREMDKK